MPVYNGARDEGVIMIQKRLLTADELLDLPDDGNHYELVKGELRMMTPAGFEHGRVAGRISVLVGQYVLQNDLGVVLVAETGFTLARSPDTVRAPDVAFVSKDRIPPADQKHKFAELGPDLVVEVVSPNDRASEIEEKVRDYLDAGVRLIWVVYPATQTITEHRPSTPARDLVVAEELQGYDILPGFGCQVAEFFA